MSKPIVASACIVFGLLCSCEQQSKIKSSETEPKVELDPALIRLADDPKIRRPYAITQEACDAQPRWVPASEALPISIEKLVNLGIDAKLSPDLPAKEYWKANTVEFHRFPASWRSPAPYPEDRKDRWYVKLSLKYNKDYEGQWSKQYTYAYLLLDGTVLETIPPEE